jgi:hypothetical protein
MPLLQEMGLTQTFSASLIQARLSRLCSRHLVGIFESFAQQSFQKYQQHL